MVFRLQSSRGTQRERQTRRAEEMETEVQGGRGGWDSWEGALEEESNREEHGLQQMGL